VLDQDTSLVNDFESDYKNNKDRVLDKYDYPYNDEGRDAFVRFETYRDTILNNRNWEQVVK